MNYRNLRRVFVISILIATGVGAVLITFVAFRVKQWETMASAMAVMAAILAIWSSLNVTWQQEDAKQPQISLFIDDTSHKFAYSLIIINRGGSPAYNVKIQWKNPIKDFEGRIPKFTDFEDGFDFEYLPTEISYSRFLIGADDFRKLSESSERPLHFDGIVSYSERPSSKFRVEQVFKVSLEPFKRRLNVLNDQMDFYFENKKITAHLKAISGSLKEISQSLSKEGKNSR